MAGAESRDPERIRTMFGAISLRYDLLNRILSLGQDVRWRRRAAAEAVAGLPPPPVATEIVLDLCGGTGDLAIEIARCRPDVRVVCADFAHPMLVRAAAKFARRGLAGRCLPLEADALRLPIADGALGTVTVAFGIRNFSDLDAGLREILRVLRPGGRLVVLEFSRPTAPFLSSPYALYLHHVLPRVGDRVSGRHGSYGYLARTIADFPEPTILAGLLRDAGFAAAGWVPSSGGIVCVHTAIKG